ncbi:hypothetical protein ACX1C1_18745 [Paenibacillus sp. strain BS8-2]
MTPSKWLWIIVAAVLTFTIWLGLYYRGVQIPHWNEEGAARSQLISSGELDVVDDIHKHIWDETVWIGLGTSNEESKYVFLKDDETTQSVNVSDVMTHDNLKSKFKSTKPNAELIRIQPGMFRGAPAWEVYYASSSDGIEYQYYDFYSFDDEAKLLETYLLPA